jgi:hypothetical protein
MSIAVSLDDLPAALADYPWGFLITVGDDLRGRTLAVPTHIEGGHLVCAAGERTRGFAQARPDVTMVFPPAAGTGFSLIVDGVATVTADGVRVNPTWAVRHRPALDA